MSATVLKPNSAEALAAWLAQNQPELFAKLLRAGGQSREDLKGLFDALSSFGSTVGTAIQSAASYLTSADGMKTLANLGGTYLQTQAQRSALATQVALARANQPLAPIYTGLTPAGQQVYVQPNAAQPPVVLTPQLAAQLQPAQQTIAGIPVLWLVGGGLALLGLLFITRR